MWREVQFAVMFIPSLRLTIGVLAACRFAGHFCYCEGFSQMKSFFTGRPLHVIPYWRIRQVMWNPLTTPTAKELKLRVSCVSRVTVSSSRHFRTSAGNAVPCQFVKHIYLNSSRREHPRDSPFGKITKVSLQETKLSSEQGLSHATVRQHLNAQREKVGCPEGGQQDVSLQSYFEFGVYIHLPYCLRRCDFCAFPILLLPNSSSQAVQEAAESHLPLLERDMETEFSAALMRQRRCLEFLKRDLHCLVERLGKDTSVKQVLEELDARHAQIVGGQEGRVRAQLFRGSAMHLLKPIASLNSSVGFNGSQECARASTNGHPTRLLKSVFFGGGTPSVMPTAVVETLLRKVFDFEKQLQELLYKQEEVFRETKRLLSPFVPDLDGQRGLKRNAESEPQMAVPEVTVEIYPGGVRQLSQKTMLDSLDFLHSFLHFVLPFHLDNSCLCVGRTRANCRDFGKGKAPFLHSLWSQPIFNRCTNIS